MAATTREAPARKRVAFALHAPDAENVSVAGDFNGWDPTARPLKRDETGNWTATLTLPMGEYQYRFFVDGNWVDDPTAEQHAPNAFGSRNCVRVVR